MTNAERKLESPPGKEIQVKQGDGNSIILITNNKTEQIFTSPEDALKRGKDALRIENSLLVIRGIVVAAIIGEIGMFIAGKPIDPNVALAGLSIIAIGTVILSVANRPDPKLIKRQIAEIKAFMKKDASVK